MQSDNNQLLLRRFIKSMCSIILPLVRKEVVAIHNLFFKSFLPGRTFTLSLSFDKCLFLLYWEIYVLVLSSLDCSNVVTSDTYLVLLVIWVFLLWTRWLWVTDVVMQLMYCLLLVNFNPDVARTFARMFAPVDALLLHYALECCLTRLLPTQGFTLF